MKDKKLVKGLSLELPEIPEIPEVPELPELPGSQS